MNSIRPDSDAVSSLVAAASSVSLARAPIEALARAATLPELAAALALAKKANQAGIAEELSGFMLKPVLDSLPEHEGPRIVSGYTVTRSEPKVGRNDPCPCGSGRKYKKCCAAREQETFGRQTALEQFKTAGVQQSRARDQIFDLMRPAELAQMEATSLTTLQLIHAVRKLTTHCRWEVAERFLDIMVTRTDVPGGDADDYRLEVADAALQAGALDVAERQIERATLGEAEQTRYRVQLALARNTPDALSQLESALEIAHNGDDNLLIECAFALLDHFPALGILAARGSISAERLLDSEMLLEQVGRARDRLDLPADEPWWDIFDFLLDSETEHRLRESHDAESVRREREIESLKADLVATNARASRLDHELSRRVAELEATATDRERLAELVEAAQTTEERMRVAELEAERQRLRGKIAEMKGEIAEGATQRAELRRKLAEAADAHRNANRAAAPENGSDHTDDDDDGEGDAVTARPRKVLVPHFTPSASRALGTIPPRVAADALQQSAHLAGGDAHAWSGAKHMRRAHEILSVRIGRSYRLLFRISDDRLDVLEVIHRRELDGAIQRIVRG